MAGVLRVRCDWLKAYSPNVDLLECVEHNNLVCFHVVLTVL